MLESDKTLFSLNATIATASYVSALDSTPPDVRGCARLVVRVYHDLQFLVILRAKHRNYLERTVIEFQHINNVILDTTNTLLTVGKHIESYREKIDGGKLKALGKLKWRAPDSERFSLPIRQLEMRQAAIVNQIEQLRKVQGAEMGNGNGNGSGNDGDFENVELMRLSPRNMVKGRGDGSMSMSSMALSSYGEDGGYGNSSRKLAGSENGLYLDVESYRASTAESRVSSRDDVGVKTFAASEHATQSPTLRSPSKSKPSPLYIIPQNKSNTRIPQSQGEIEPLSHQTTLPLSHTPPQSTHPQSSTPSLPSISSRARSNTFAMQALRESEFENNFSSPFTLTEDWCSSPSTSASFMSSRVSTISSRTSVGSTSMLSRKGSSNRSRRAFSRRPSLVVGIEALGLKHVSEGETYEEEDDVAEMNGASWEPTSSRSNSGNPLPFDEASLLERSSISEVENNDRSQQASFAPSQDLRVKSSESFQYPMGEGAEQDMSLQDTTLLSIQELSNSFKNITVAEVSRSHLGEDEDDPDDYYFRELKLQELERKKRLSARRR